MKPIGRAAIAPSPSADVPLYLDAVSAGFPSPADDYVETALDLNRYLVTNPAATFMVRVGGDSMIDAGILDGDVLIVDRSREAKTGRIVVAVVDGELTVKRLGRFNGRIFLLPENSAYRPIEIHEEQELTIWGVVSGVVRKL
ncbi:LexA family protein [Pseudodesulfovibrio sp.]|uniref:LexA family protein n=1 Tax=unclassified Pseudodesulfovibrio TaxID=2661612 RepID=UPI003B0083F0